LSANDPAATAALGGSAPWRAVSGRDILRWPLPAAGFVNRLVQRSVGYLANRQLGAIHGLDNLRGAREPYIVGVNHSIKREALLVPSLLILHRGGRWCPFVADWNYALIPVVGWVMRRSGAIFVTRKPARPAFLNPLKRFYLSEASTAERVRALLRRGQSVGMFPEGTVNRSRDRLLPGRLGLAFMSLQNAAPVIPVGVRFPGADPREPIPEDAVMDIHIGSPLEPPAIAGDRPPIGDVRMWHATVMTEIARLSGKAWGPQPRSGDDAS